MKSLDAFRRVSLKALFVQISQPDSTSHCSQALYNPIVHRLGFEYLDSDSADTTQLRTRAIHHAALAEDSE